MSQKKDSGREAGVPVIFNLSSDQCVWARAGLTPPRLCHNAFDCLSCAFDKKVQRERAGARLRDGDGLPFASWRDLQVRQTRTADERRCRHEITGRVANRTCALDFDCARCSFDQMLDDETLSHPPGTVEVSPVAGFALAENYYYHPGHTWARLEYGGRVRVGLDDFAARLFGPQDRISLPDLGQQVQRGAGEVTLLRKGLTAALQCPVSGVVVAVNPNLDKSPQAAHQDPYGQGWLFLVEPAKLQADLRKLLFAGQARLWLDEEAGRLAALVAGETELPLAATGGRAVEDIFSSLPGLDWARLAREFLLN